MGRILVLLYGTVSYVFFLVSFLYAIGFLGNLVVPKTVDGPGQAPLTEALLINTLLLGLFAVQHSVMARKGFKQWWTKFVPESIERSTYVLFTSLALLLLYWQWRPLPEPLWSIGNPTAAAVMQGVFALGWLTVLLATFMINHFHLFGLFQVWEYFQGREPVPLAFRTVGFYNYVRHPIQLGFLIAFWATPTMTVGHLLFAAATTGYIFIGLHFEERDLVKQFGDTYTGYRQQVSMLIPTSKLKPELLKRGTEEPDQASAKAASEG